MSSAFELKGGFQAYINAPPIQDVPINSFKVMQNCFVFQGHLKKRPQYFCHASFSYTSLIYSVQEMYSERSGGIYKDIAFLEDVNLRVLTLADLTSFSVTTNWTLTKPLPQWTKAGEINFSNISLAAFADKGVKVYRNGSGALRIFPIGLPICPSSPDIHAITSGGSWTLTAPFTIDYKYTWVASDGYEVVEGNGTSIRDLITLTNATYSVYIARPAVPTGYTNITHWRIYRLVETVDTTYKLMVTVPIGTSSYVDPGNLTLPSANDEVPITDHSQPPENPVCIGYHGDRLWLGGVSGKVYYSKVNSPAGSCQLFSALQFFQVGDSDEAFIKFLSYPTFLLIIKRNSMWVIEGSDVSTFRLQKISNMGAMFPQSTVLHNGYLYFVNELGIWKTNLYDIPQNLALSIWKDFLTIQANSGVYQMQGNCALFDASLQCIWFKFIAFPNSLFLLDPVKGYFVGKFEIPVILSFFVLVNSFAKYTFGFGRYVSAGVNKLYFNNTGVFGAYSYTSETSFAVLAQTGMAIPDETQLRKRMFRSMQFFSNLAADSPTTYGTESMVIKTALASSTTYVAVTTPTIVLGSTSGNFKHVNIGRADRGISISFEQAAANPNITWEIGQCKFEYDNIGHW